MEAANKTLPIVQITDNGGKTNQQAMGGKGSLPHAGQKSAGRKVVWLFQRLHSNTSHSTGAPAQALSQPGGFGGQRRLSSPVPSEQSSKAAAD